MIPHDFITEWRRFAPWILDSQVEQDLVISRALVEMFRHPEIRKQTAFRGGTALYKLHLPSARYSDDIDLVQVSPGPIGPVITALRISRPTAWRNFSGRNFEHSTSVAKAVIFSTSGMRPDVRQPIP